MNTQSQINKLASIEKAVKKLQSVIVEYNKVASDPQRTQEVNRSYYSKAVAIVKKAKAEHSNTLTSLWNNGVFA